MPKENFTAVDIVDGSDASTAVNNDPKQAWYAQQGHTSVVIDMGESKKISALGHYPYRFVMREILEKNLKISDMLKAFPHKYKVSVSLDGENFCEVASGSIRVFGQEEIVVFGETEARYVKFEVVQTVGDRCGNSEYANAPVCLGELTVFERK